MHNEGLFSAIATAGHEIDVVFDFDEHFTSPDLQRGMYMSVCLSVCLSTAVDAFFRYR